MIVQSIEIINFRGISHLRLNLQKGINVLLGGNGAGKSTILDALALGLSWYTARFANPKANGQSIDEADIRLGENEAAITLTVAFSNSTSPVSWTTYGYRRGPGKRKDSDYSQLNQYIASVGSQFVVGQTGIPVVVYYPTTRAVVDVPERIKKTHDFSTQLAAYDGSLGVGADFRVFFEWFKDQEDQERDSGPNDSPLPIKLVRTTVSRFMGFEDMKVRRRPLTKMVLTKEGAEIAVAQLSDGEKIYLSLVADLVRRIGIANLGIETTEQASGVVLIDEVELHLHPRWQREILAKLTQVFPGLQFLVTTHSPQVIGEAARDRTWIIEAEDGDRVLTPVTLAFGASSDLILSAVMGAPERDPEVKAEIEHLYTLMTDKFWDEVRKGIANLSQTIPGDPAIDRLRAALKRHEVLGR